MIEQLEARTFFSTTPHAALSVLRVDVASIGHRINTMIAANNSAVANLQSDVSIFPASAAANNAELRLLNVRFRSRVTALANDFNNVKVLLGRDITQLINDSNAYNRHPTASVGAVVQAAQQQLTAQGIAASTNLSLACSQMQRAYQQALALLSASHPVDSTLTARVSHISTAFATNIQSIQTTANTIAVADIPNLITALEPSGIVTTSAA